MAATLARTCTRGWHSRSLSKPYWNSIVFKSSNSPIGLRYVSSPAEYKAARRSSQTPLAPVQEPVPSWSAPAAVSSILYETPAPPTDAPKRHVLNAMVVNEPGVLSRVSGVLAARGFNIDSLVVCSTEVPDLSRMTIVLQGQDAVIEQARRQLEDLVPVWAVNDYTAVPLVQRELLLAKISIMGPEHFEEVLSHHRQITGTSSAVEAIESEEGDIGEDALGLPRADFHPANLSTSHALRQKNEHLTHVTHLTHQFGGKVLDISNSSCVVEVSAKPTRIDAFLKLVSPFGILQAARSGLMAIPRSQLHAAPATIKEAEDVVDSSILPPG